LKHVKNGIEIPEDGENRVAVGGKELAVVDGGVGRADQLEDGGACIGSVEVVGQIASAVVEAGDEVIFCWRSV